jgi:carbamoyltransferase
MAGGKPITVLGVSAFYHDAAACLVRDGEIVAAAEEERFSRVKGDARMPLQAIRYVLEEGGVATDELTLLAFYDKPITKFNRILTSHLTIAPRGWGMFKKVIRAWTQEKLWIPWLLRKAVEDLGYRAPERVLFTEHHDSHAASAFLPSPFERAAILTLDGVGEIACCTIGAGNRDQVRLLKQMPFPHSLGLLYSAFTSFTGFKVNSGEYKLMGLAPYGEPAYVDRIKEKLVRIYDDGSFHLDLEYFGFLDEERMTNDAFHRLFDGPPRMPETEITRREMDLARSIQEVTNEIVLKMARHARGLTGEKNLCMAGGVALNGVANGHLVREGTFDRVFVQPAAGDAGGALGAALFGYYRQSGAAYVPKDGKDRMKGAYLGPGFSDDAVERYLKERGYPYQRMDDPELAAFAADALATGKVVALCRGRMEFGPRALGNRSILADARNPEMQSRLNLATKFRESFRPFAPSVLREDLAATFDFPDESPYMLMVAPVRKELRRTPEGAERPATLKAWIHQPRSTVPAVTHVDYSARLHTVDADRNPFFHRLLRAFKDKTGCSVIVNTSFNVRSEPIVCTPDEAYACFMRTGIDILVLNNFVLAKDQQPPWTEKDDWKDQFDLD